MSEESLLAPGRIPWSGTLRTNRISKRVKTTGMTRMKRFLALPVFYIRRQRYGGIAVIEEWREIRQGDIFLANIPEERRGSIQAGRRPVIVISADWLNRTSTVFTVAELTSSLKNPTMPVHYLLPMLPHLPKRSMVLGEATARLIRKDFISYKCRLSKKHYTGVDRAVRCGMRKKNRHKNKKTRRRANSRKGNIRQ